MKIQVMVLIGFVATNAGLRAQDSTRVDVFVGTNSRAQRYGSFARTFRERWTLDIRNYGTFGDSHESPRSTTLVGIGRQIALSDNLTITPGGFVSNDRKLDIRSKTTSSFGVSAGLGWSFRSKRIESDGFLSIGMTQGSTRLLPIIDPTSALFRFKRFGIGISYELDRQFFRMTPNETYGHSTTGYSKYHHLVGPEFRVNHKCGSTGLEYMFRGGGFRVIQTIEFPLERNRTNN